MKKSFILDKIFPETFDYSDEKCLKIAIHNYCEKHKIRHLETEIFEEILENF